MSIYKGQNTSVYFLVAQENISQGCVPPACVNHTCFNSHEQGDAGSPCLMSEAQGGGPRSHSFLGGWGSPRSHVQEGGARVGPLFSEVQCILGNGHMGTPL